jgi:hypothetical protein
MQIARLVLSEVNDKMRRAAHYRPWANGDLDKALYSTLRRPLTLELPTFPGTAKAHAEAAAVGIAFPELVRDYRNYHKSFEAVVLIASALPIDLGESLRLTKRVKNFSCPLLFCPKTGSR